MEEPRGSISADEKRDKMASWQDRKMVSTSMWPALSSLFSRSYVVSDSEDLGLIVHQCNVFGREARHSRHCPKRPDDQRPSIHSNAHASHAVQSFAKKHAIEHESSRVEANPLAPIIPSLLFPTKTSHFYLQPNALGITKSHLASLSSEIEAVMCRSSPECTRARGTPIRRGTSRRGGVLKHSEAYFKDCQQICH